MTKILCRYDSLNSQLHVKIFSGIKIMPENNLFTGKIGKV